MSSNRFTGPIFPLPATATIFDKKICHFQILNSILKWHVLCFILRICSTYPIKGKLFQHNTTYIENKHILFQRFPSFHVCPFEYTAVAVSGKVERSLTGLTTPVGLLLLPSVRNRFWWRFMLSRCFLDFSVDVGVFVTGLSQISSFFSK